MRSGPLLLLEQLELGLGGDQRHSRLVEIGRRADAAVEQLGLAVEIGLGGGQVLARQLDLPRQAGQVGLEGGKVALDALELRLRLLRGEAIGNRVDGEQLVAGLEQLALDHGDAHDLARDLRRDQHLLGADVGVVGRHVAAAEEIEPNPTTATSAGTSTSSVSRSGGSFATGSGADARTSQDGLASMARSVGRAALAARGPPPCGCCP